MYNVRKIDYLGYSEVQIFLSPVFEKGDRNFTKKSDSSTLINPFYDVDSDEPLLIHEFKEVDYERSISSSISRTRKNIIDIARSNNFDYFFTFTLDKNKIDRYNYDVISKKISQFFKNFKRRKAPNFEYILVPEKHFDGAFHFHGMLRGVPSEYVVYSGKKDKKGRKIYNFSAFSYGFTTLTEVSDLDKCVSYILKYITKDLVDSTKYKKRFWYSSTLNKARKTNLFLEFSEIDVFLSSLGIDDKTKRFVHHVSVGSYSNDITYIRVPN